MLTSTPSIRWPAVFDRPEDVLLRLRGGREGSADDTDAGGAPATKGGGEGEDDSDAAYEEVDLQDMEFDEIEEAYTYPCPCGDEFRIAHSQLMAGERIALCPSCSLKLSIKATDAVIDAMNKAVLD